MDGAASHPGRGRLERRSSEAAGLRLRHFSDPRHASVRLVDDAADVAPHATVPLAEPRPRSLLSSCSGRIRHVLFVLTGALLVGAPSPAETVLRAAAAVPKLSIVAHRSAIPRVKALLMEVGRREGFEIITALDNAVLWGWAQDRCVICHDDRGAPVIVHGFSVEAVETARYAGRACPDGRAHQTALRLEGGNILVDEDVCLVGADLADESGFADRFRSEIEAHRTVIAIGGEGPLPRRGPTRCRDLRWREAVDRNLSRPGSRQPVFHLDMFMTLAGKRRVLVGDPLAARRLTGLPLPESVPLDAFDAIARDLDQRGFEVIRNPLPLVYFDDPEARLREWFYASANNCWVEHCPDGSRVWLPQYGFGAWPELEATDAANARIWRELGFEVILAGDFLPLADQLGALNCVSKILERET